MDGRNAKIRLNLVASVALIFFSPSSNVCTTFPLHPAAKLLYEAARPRDTPSVPYRRDNLNIATELGGGQWSAPGARICSACAAVNLDRKDFKGIKPYPLTASHNGVS